MNRLNFLTLVFLTFSLSSIHAQQVMCGADQYSYELYRDNPALQNTMAANRSWLKHFTEQYAAAHQNRAADSVYTVPVVFHVIHMYGVENISDSQVLSGLAVLNRNFANKNPDSANIVAAFKPLAADCQIEFKLAHLDPNGNCTSGINRIASPLTKYGYHSVKDLIHWNPSKYLNVYIVRSIPSLAGHCLMPDQADVKPEWDGIVIDDSYVGNIGTSSELTSVVMAHETGHYLNLFHIWGGNNVPGYFYQQVGQQANCGIGDDVQDTPETIGWSTCNLAAASCGNTVDNVQNAMDYSYCNFMFTQGQRTRMRAALNSPVAQRNNLITPANLAATGVNLNTVCNAAFTVDRSIVCYGDTVYFTDKSVTTPTNWQWNFGDNTTDNAQNPSHVFGLPGDYYVTLTASANGGGATSDSVLVHVNDFNALPYFVEGFESVSNVWQAGLIAKSDNDKLKFEIDNGGYLGGKAVAIQTQDTLYYTGRISLTSRAIDVTNTISPQFSFRYACSQFKLNNDDALEVFISTDCGRIWLSKGKRFGANLRTVTTAVDDTTWLPADTSQWKTYSFNLTGQQSVNNFMFRIEYTSYYTNAFLLDNINLNEEAYNAIPKLQLQDIAIVPNPGEGIFNLQGDFEELDMVILDVNGRVVFRKDKVAPEQVTDVRFLPSGVYLVRLENETSQATLKLLR